MYLDLTNLEPSPCCPNLRGDPFPQMQGPRVSRVLWTHWSRVPPKRGGQNPILGPPYRGRSPPSRDPMGSPLRKGSKRVKPDYAPPLLFSPLHGVRGAYPLLDPLSEGSTPPKGVSEGYKSLRNRPIGPFGHFALNLGSL